MEGMVQRISSVDSQISARPRTYLDLYAFKHLRSNTTSVGNCEVYTGSFLHFWHILKILRGATQVYVHSIYFYTLIVIPLLFTKKATRIILDVHGAVPEELLYEGKLWFSAVMGLVEKWAFSRVSTVVCVTRKMERYYRAKYPRSLASFLYFPIFTAHVCKPANSGEVDALRLRLGIGEDDNVYLYSGGQQTWQNIERMLRLAKSILAQKENWCIFLTGDTKALTELVHMEFGYVPERLLVAHATTRELRNYYELANFGFILREDHILNRVANPTKLVEYLYFGMTPIVWLPEIGDFTDLGYEFVGLDALDTCAVRPRKSERNRQISRQLLADAEQANLFEHF
jgi:hypothetical protein